MRKREIRRRFKSFINCWKHKEFSSCVIDSINKMIMNQTVRRESNFELLRVICMLFIVWGHLMIAFSGEESVGGLDYLETHFLRSFTVVAVNVFVLISGYFSISFKLSRVLKLGEQTWFYSVILFVFAVFIGWHEIKPAKDIAYLVPIFSKQYWFITIYVILYFLSPILNKMSLYLSAENFKSILIIGFFLIYVWHTIGFIFNFGLPIEDAGYGIPNFVYLYLLGRYLKIHCGVSMSKRNLLLGYIFICISLFLFQLLYSLALGFSFTALYSYNTVFVFLGGGFLFLFFAKLKIKYNKYINVWAKNCLAVYIIHMHPLFWNKICEFLQIEEIPPLYFIPYSLGMSIILYFALATVEKIRLFFFDKIENRFNDKIMNIQMVKNIENMIKLTKA